MAVKISKVKVSYYEMDCNGNNLRAYVYGGFIIAIEPDGTIRKFSYNKEFFDGCKMRHRVVTLTIVHGYEKSVVMLPDGHAVPIP